MTKIRLTMLFGALGWVLSYAMFLKFLRAHGWDFLGGWVEAFTASDFGTGLLLDLVATTGMMIVLAIGDRRRLGGRGAFLRRSRPSWCRPRRRRACRRS